jgi:hypothetical protein
MEFPRFTQGNVGAMTFAHVNAVFERIERLEAQAGLSSSVKAESRMGRVINVMVTSINAQGQVAWKEVARSGAGTWADVAGGATSAQGSNATAIPLIGAGTVAGVVMQAVMRRDSSGAFVYHAMRQESPEWFIILGSTGTGPRWTYTARRAVYVDATTGWAFDPSSSAILTMVNSAENVVDTNTEIGLGTIVPSGVTKVRRPIKINTVVTASRDANGVMAFFAPNGYQVTCG